MQEFISEVIEGVGEGGLGIKLYKDDVLNDIGKPYISEFGSGKQRLYMKKAEVTKLQGLVNEQVTDVNAISGAIDIVDEAESITYSLCRDRLYGTMGTKPTDMAVEGLDSVYTKGPFQVRAAQATTGFIQALNIKEPWPGPMTTESI